MNHNANYPAVQHEKQNQNHCKVTSAIQLNAISDHTKCLINLQDTSHATSCHTPDLPDQSVNQQNSINLELHCSYARLSLSEMLFPYRFLPYSKPELLPRPELPKDSCCLAFCPLTALLVISTISSSLCLQLLLCRDNGTASKLTFRSAMPGGRSFTNQGCFKICCTVMRLSGSTSNKLVSRSVHSGVKPCITTKENTLTHQSLEVIQQAATLHKQHPRECTLLQHDVQHKQQKVDDLLQPLHRSHQMQFVQRWHQVISPSCLC